MFDDPELPVILMGKLIDKGIITFLLLFEKRALRISPPLTISDEEIIYACEIINETIEEMM